MITPTVVVAGYGSWAKTAINPAAEAVAALKKQRAAIQSAPDHNPEYDLHCLEIPVDSNALYTTLEQALLKYKPDLWIGVGVAVESPVIRLETTGINVRYFDVPDNRGEKLEAISIITDGPMAYRTNLPNEKIVQHLCQALIPAVVSHHAGTHLCNQMLYSVLDLVKKQELNITSGFIHVPQSTDNVARSIERERRCSSMSIPMMTDALQIAVDFAVQWVKHGP